MVYWVSFPQRYQLQDVQAFLNVTIAVLSASGIFVTVRFCWQAAAIRYAGRKNIPTYSLLSLNTVGEAWDVFWLLKRDLFKAHYLGLLAQCLIVLSLTASTILSGFIARFSTQYGHIVKVMDVNGTLAERSVRGVVQADVEWNLTISNFNRAGVPMDQMMEYLPDQTVDWMWQKDQWNNSWSLDCKYTEKTEIQLESGTNCTNILYEVPGITQFWDPDYWDDASIDSTTWQTELTTYQDTLSFLHGIKYGDIDNDTESYPNAIIAVASLHMSDVPTAETPAENCSFVPGKIGPSSYTMIQCQLHQKPGTDKLYAANPERVTINAVASAYGLHYAARFRQEAARNREISDIPPQELVRLFQAYHLIKDTCTGAFTTRKLDVSVQVPQISLGCLIVVCLATLVVLLGLLNHALFVTRHWDSFNQIPETKLDWMLKTIDAQGDKRLYAREKLRSSVMSGIDDDSIPLKSSRSSIRSTSTIRESWQPHRGSTSSSYSAYSPLQAPNSRDYWQGHTAHITQSPSHYTSYSPVQNFTPNLYSEPLDTGYDPGRRPNSQVQPIEDGYFLSGR